MDVPLFALKEIFGENETAVRYVPLGLCFIQW